MLTYLTELKKQLKMNSKQNIKVLVILGQHRSGSSVLSGALMSMGGYLGVDYQHEEDEYNEKGYFESSWTDHINNQILNAIGCSWHHIIGLPEDWFLSPRLSHLYGVVKDYITKDILNTPIDNFYMLKDPRISILLPFYLKVFDELNISPSFIFSDRNNEEIKESLVKRDGLNAESLDGMIEYHRLYVKKYIGNRPIIWSNTFANVSYKPIKYFNYIKEYLNIPLNITPNTVKHLNSFIDMNLKHNNTKKCVKVISTYFGPRRTNTNYNPILNNLQGIIPKTSGIKPTIESIKQLVKNERSIDSGVFMDTIIVNHNIEEILDSNEALEFLDTIDGTPTRNGVFRVINRPWENGVGGSFKSFDFIYQKHKNDYHYWMFTEDNVIQIKDNYYKDGISQLNQNNNIGYICTYRCTSLKDNPHHKPHCHGGSGITTIEKLNTINDKFGSLCYYKEPFTPKMIETLGLPEFSHYSSAWYRNFEELGEVDFTNSFIQGGFKLEDSNRKDKISSYYGDCV